MAPCKMALATGNISSSALANGAVWLAHVLVSEIEQWAACCSSSQTLA